MTEATLFKFPCDFPLKVMGRRSDDFRSIVLGIVQLLLMVVITLAIAILGWLLWEGVTAKLASIHTVPELQVALQRGFAGVLLVTGPPIFG